MSGMSYECFIRSYRWWAKKAGPRLRYCSPGEGSTYAAMIPGLQYGNMKNTERGLIDRFQFNVDRLVVK